MDIAKRWARTWTHVGIEPPKALLDDIVAAYSEDHRRYHTAEHLEECFTHLDRSPIAPQHAAAVELALWFHDAIYDTRASDNEERFETYEEQVRGEYEWVPMDAYRPARARILQTFADRPRLYHTDPFHDRLEARARGNLARSIAALDDATPAAR